MAAPLDQVKASSHKHTCRECGSNWPGYGSKFGSRAICKDSQLTLCASCLAPMFPKVKAYVSPSYREARNALLDKAEKQTIREVGYRSGTKSNEVWTRVFFDRMDELAAEL